MIQVLIADDHSGVRHGLRRLLDRAIDIKVVAEAQNGQEAVQMAQALQPDVIIMDISMPVLDGIQATEQIQTAGVSTRVIILSMHANANFVKEAFRKGAVGYVLKRMASTEIEQAVRMVRQGKTFLSPVLKDALLP